MTVDRIKPEVRNFDATSVTLNHMTGQTPAENHQQGQNQQAPMGGGRGHGGSRAADEQFAFVDEFLGEAVVEVEEKFLMGYDFGPPGLPVAGVDEQA